MRIGQIVVVGMLLAGLCGPVLAQVDDRAADSDSSDIPVQHWRIGMVVSAVGGGCARLTGTMTVPMDWPEQRVKIVKEDLSPGVTVSYKMLGAGVKQMVVKIPHVASGQEAQAVVTFAIQRSRAQRPDDTASYVVPDPKSLKGAMKDYLAPSPYIESNHPRVKELAKQIAAGHEKAWDRVKATYQWVNEKLKYVPKKKGPYEQETDFTGVVEAIDRGTGDCNEITSTFIALCRAQGIPARLVRIFGHCYPEFYLLDDQGQGHWFPCEEMFGRVAQQTPILQKGDSYRVSTLDPASRRLKTETVRFPRESLTGMPGAGGGQPQMRLICQPVDNP